MADLILTAHEQPSLGQVTLNLSPPPSVNRIWQRGRKGKVYRSKAYTDWLRHSHLMAGRPGRVDGRVLIRIRITGGKGWRRGRDVDNIQKPAIDFLVHCGVIADDNWEIVRRVTVYYCDPVNAKEKASIRVTVRRLPGES